MPIVNNIDLGKILTQAAQLNRYKLDAEERRHKMEMDRRQQELVNKVVAAQRRVFQAKTPEARESAEAELGSLDAARLAKIRSDRRAEEDQVLGVARKRRELSIDQNLAGARLMKDVLPGVVQQTPAGPQVNLPALFQATGRMTQMAQQGIVAPEQAQRLQDMFRDAAGMAKQIQASGGYLPPDQLQSINERQQKISGQVQDLLAGADQGIEMFGDPEKRKRFQSDLEKIAGRAAEISGDVKAVDYEYAIENQPEAVEQARRELSEAKMSRAKAAGRTIVIKEGQQYDPVTRGARTAFHKDAFAAQAMLSNLKAIDINKASEFQTIQAGAKAAGARILDAFGVLEKIAGAPAVEFLGARRVFREKVDRVFNQYRREVTGAQAAFVELERLKDSIMNADLGPTELKASYEAFVKEMERIDRIRRRVLRKGFNVSDPEAFGRAIDEEYLKDRGASYAEDVEPIIKDLRSRNPDITDEEIERNLETLGL